MKKFLLLPLAVFGLISGAHAQSSVTLFGLLDSALTYSSNQGGGRNWQAQDGAISPNRFGFMGTEDLGQGNKVLFVLESGFSLYKGAYGQGGLEFGRQAYVALSNERFGTISMGRQYEAMVDDVAPFTANGGWSVLFQHPGDVDNTNRGFRANSSVKYVSRDLAGFQAEALYSFGGQPGATGKDSIWSAGAKYARGPFSAGFGVTHVNTPRDQTLGTFWTTTNTVSGAYALAATSYLTYGGGAAYRIGAGRIAAAYTNTSFNEGFGGANVKFQNYEVNGSYYITPAFLVMTGYTFTDGHVDATGANPKYHQFNGLLDYFLSKRTDLYLAATYQRAAGSALVAQASQFLSASNSNRQTVVSIGIRHRF